MKTDVEENSRALTPVKPQPVENMPIKGPLSTIEPAHTTDLGNLEKIRDILFGSQARDYEKRLNRLEDTLLRQSLELRAEIKQRCEALEAHVQREVDALQAQLKGEQTERLEVGRKLSQDIKETKESLDTQAAQLADSITSAQRNLRQQLLEQSSRLGNEVRDKYAELTGLIEQHLHEVRNDKVDRAALSALLMDMALRLNPEV